jgi:hypothetical protein
VKPKSVIVLHGPKIAGICAQSHHPGKEDNIIGRVIEYDSDRDPPFLKFLD